MFTYYNSLVSSTGTYRNAVRIAYDYMRERFSVLPHFDFPALEQYSLPQGSIDMLNCISQIENLNFLDNPNFTTNEIYLTTYDSYKLSVESRFKNNHRTGLVIHQTPGKNRFTYFTEGMEIERLEAAEADFKQSNTHRINIFTIKDSNYLFVDTNQVLYQKTLLKLYALKMSLIKDKLPHFNENVMNFVLALIENDKEKFVKTVNDLFEDEYLKDFSFREITHTLRSRKRRLLSQLNVEIDSCRSEIRNYRAALTRELERLNNKLLQYSNLEKAEDDFDAQLVVKYLKKSPYIKEVTKRNSHSIILKYEAPLIYYDDYLLENLMSNKEGKEYDILQLFVDKDYELIARCSIKFDIETLDASQNDYISNSETAISHPHIDQYNCFGNHSELFAEAAENGDMLYALEEVTQAVLNINFSDYIVVNNMLSILQENEDKKWWRDKKTGEMVSTKELLG